VVVYNESEPHISHRNLKTDEGDVCYYAGWSQWQEDFRADKFRNLYASHKLQSRRLIWAQPTRKTKRILNRYFLEGLHTHTHTHRDRDKLFLNPV